MSRWDELEAQFKEMSECSNYPVKWHADVLTLIEQNRELLEALKLAASVFAGNSINPAVTEKKIQEVIRKSAGEEA